jgi:hypothetical protein|tara:strand:- start:2430 stop:2873 length:444 start_codon:yes stop_codon:yes gene_type:complete
MSYGLSVQGYLPADMFLTIEDIDNLKELSQTDHVYHKIQIKAESGSSDTKSFIIDAIYDNLDDAIMEYFTMTTKTPLIKASVIKFLWGLVFRNDKIVADSGLYDIHSVEWFIIEANKPPMKFKSKIFTKPIELVWNSLTGANPIFNL